MIIKDKANCYRDGEIQSGPWLQIKISELHMAWARLARTRNLEVCCFYAESFELNNTYRGFQISWGAGAARGSEAQGLPLKVPEGAALCRVHKD